MRLCRVRTGDRGHTRGLTVIEVTLALAILCAAVAASGSAFLSNLAAVRSARRANEGALFLETILQDLSAQPYDALLAFDGNTFYDRVSEDKSDYRVRLSVFASAVDLEQIRAVLSDLRTGREIGRVLTQRSRR